MSQKIYVLTSWFDYKDSEFNHEARIIGVFSSFENAKKAAEEDLMEILKQECKDYYKGKSVHEALLYEVEENVEDLMSHLYMQQYRIKNVDIDNEHDFNPSTHDCRKKTVSHDPEFHIDIDFNESFPENENERLTRESIKNTIYTAEEFKEKMNKKIQEIEELIHKYNSKN